MTVILEKVAALSLKIKIEAAFYLILNFFLSDELFLGGINLFSNSSRDAIENGVGRRPSTPTQLLYMRAVKQNSNGGCCLRFNFEELYQKIFNFSLKMP